mgnify:CR=1 FL=1
MEEVGTEDETLEAPWAKAPGAGGGIIGWNWFGKAWRGDIGWSGGMLGLP